MTDIPTTPEQHPGDSDGLSTSPAADAQRVESDLDEDGADPHNVDDDWLSVLARGGTHAEAAAMRGRSAKWVQRRLRDPGPRRRLVELRSERMDRAGSLATDALADAVDLLRAELDGDTAGDRMRAAGLLISSAVRLRQQTELTGLVADLRAELDEVRATIEELS